MALQWDLQVVAETVGTEVKYLVDKLEQLLDNYLVV